MRCVCGADLNSTERALKIELTLDLPQKERQNVWSKPNWVYSLLKEKTRNWCPVKILWILEDLESHNIIFKMSRIHLKITSKKKKEKRRI